MKQTLIILFTLMTVTLLSQDSIQTVIMEVDYIEMSDSISIQKKITYTYPSGEKMVREFVSMPDSVFIIREEEEIQRVFEERQRIAEELQRLVLEIQSMDIYLQQADEKFSKIKLKKNKNK